MISGKSKKKPGARRSGYGFAMGVTCHGGALGGTGGVGLVAIDATS
jgi:hypothetical protein